jgi:hypothetical protein
MQTVYIHIGQHKTGTSSIQRFLTLNRKKLFDLGFIYPNLYELTASHYIAWMLGFGGKEITHIEKSATKDIIIKAIEECYKKKKNIIISSEHFSSNITCEKLLLLKNLFKDFNIKIICYLRRQDLYAESFYNQLIKNGNTIDFDAYIQNTSLDWNIFLNNYEQVFGKENILVFPYNFHNNETPNIYEHFLSTLSILYNDFIFNNIERVNKSYPIEVILLLRLLNSHRDNIPKSGIRNPFISFFNHYLIDNFPINENLSFLSYQERIDLYNKYKESNRILAKKYLHGKDIFFENIEHKYKNSKKIDKLNNDQLFFLTFEFLRRQFEQHIKY